MNGGSQGMVVRKKWDYIDQIAQIPVIRCINPGDLMYSIMINTIMYTLSLLSGYLFLNFYWIMVDLYVVVVSGVWKIESVIHFHISTLFYILFPCMSLQRID